MLTVDSSARFTIELLDEGGIRVKFGGSGISSRSVYTAIILLPGIARSKTLRPDVFANEITFFVSRRQVAREGQVQSAVRKKLMELQLEADRLTHTSPPTSY